MQQQMQAALTLGGLGDGEGAGVGLGEAGVCAWCGKHGPAVRQGHQKTLFVLAWHLLVC